MKFLSVRDLRSKSAQVWQDLPSERELIITSNGRPIAILAAISETNLEESLKLASAQLRNEPLGKNRPCLHTSSDHPDDVRP